MKKLLIVVPYRDRPEHLKEFAPAITTYLGDQGDVCIVEQIDDKPFNRGKLLNIGFLENPHYDAYVFHDVDMIPIKVDYVNNAGVTQLASSIIQKTDYLGGVTYFTHKWFERIDGYSNEFFSRAEDNEMMFNLKRRGIKPGYKPGYYKNLPHARNGVLFDPVLWERAQQPREKDGLGYCEYGLIEIEVFNMFLKIKVEL